MINLGSTMGAIEFILKRTETEISHKKLLKLLYLADRESLFRFGWPITQDTPTAMENGPVLKGVYALLKHHTAKDRDIFLNFFNVSENKISLKKNFTDDWLSMNDQEILEEICKNYGDKDGRELSEFTHQLPEWDGKNPMSWDEILRKNSRDDMLSVYEDLNTMLEDAPNRDELLEYA